MKNVKELFKEHVQHYNGANNGLSSYMLHEPQ